MITINRVFKPDKFDQDQLVAAIFELLQTQIQRPQDVADLETIVSAAGAGRPRQQPG